MITKSVVTYEISTMVIDYSGSDAGDRDLLQKCDFVLEVNSQTGEPIRLVLKQTDINKFIGQLRGHCVRSLRAV